MTCLSGVRAAGVCQSGLSGADSCGQWEGSVAVMAATLRSTAGRKNKAKYTNACQWAAERRVSGKNVVSRKLRSGVRPRNKEVIENSRSSPSSAQRRSGVRGRRGRWSVLGASGLR